MKRSLPILIALILCVVLCSCKSKDATAADDMILAIGEVTEVKDYMVVNYVRDLKDQGFEEDKDRNLLLSEFGVSTGDTMYLKNSKYSLMLLYAFNTLAISITF